MSCPQCLVDNIQIQNPMLPAAIIEKLIENSIISTNSIIAYTTKRKIINE